MVLRGIFKKFVQLYELKNPEDKIWFSDEFEGAMGSLQKFNWNVELLNIDIKITFGDVDLDRNESSRLTQVLRDAANSQPKRELNDEERILTFIEYAEMSGGYNVGKLKEAYYDLKCANFKSSTDPDTGMNIK